MNEFLRELADLMEKHGAFIAGDGYEADGITITVGGEEVDIPHLDTVDGVKHWTIWHTTYESIRAALEKREADA